MTAHADELLQDQCFCLGANDVFSKPVPIEMIDQILKNHTTKARDEHG